MEKTISFKINGEKRQERVRVDLTLLEFIRDHLGLTGTKEGCGEGECGACTVLVDGKPLRACLLLAVEIEGKEILTIEGLAQNGKLHFIQQAFIEEGAIQCGFCTPGFVLAVYGLYLRKQKPDRAEIMEALSGHLCRCTGYENIFKAAQKVLS